MHENDDIEPEMPSKDMNYSQDIPVSETFRDDDATNVTLASTSYDYDFENGRTYHAYKRGDHMFPNDSINERHEHIANTLFLRTLDDKLYLAPIQAPRCVLDIGTGVGLWALSMADQFPEAQIRGIDLNQVKPREAIPTNLEYVREDITQDWIDPFKYDFVHLRSLFSSKIEWDELYSRVFDHMESGGYIEQVEVEIVPRSDDNSMPPNSIFISLGDQARDFKEEIGRDFNISDGMRDLIQKAGFVDVVEERFKLPLGRWSSDERYREIGGLMEQYFRTGVQGWLMRALTGYYQRTRKEVDELVSRCSTALNLGREHVYYTLVVVHGRKP